MSPEDRHVTDDLGHLRVVGDTLISIIDDGDPSTTVSTCPGWALGDLADHVAEAWTFWTRIVSRGIVARDDVRTIGALARPDDIDITTWLRRQLDELIVAIDTQPDTPPSDGPGTRPSKEVWTWTGANRPIGWVRRRMTHETLVHAWDAALATETTERLAAVVEPGLAADGVDEFLTWFAAGQRRDGAARVAGTVHLHCTDTSHGSGEWYIAAMKEPGATFTREHRKGDAAVRGTARDLMMWLWRRPATVEVIGKSDVAERFRVFTDLS